MLRNAMGVMGSNFQEKIVANEDELFNVISV